MVIVSLIISCVFDLLVLKMKLTFFKLDDSYYPLKMNWEYNHNIS